MFRPATRGSWTAARGTARQEAEDGGEPDPGDGVQGKQPITGHIQGQLGREAISLEFRINFYRFKSSLEVRGWRDSWTGGQIGRWTDGLEELNGQKADWLTDRQIDQLDKITQ